MNSEEQRIRKQLARYGSSVSTEPAQEQESEVESEGQSDGPFEYKVPEGWQPPPRYLRPEDVEDHSANFQVGDIYRDVRPSGYVAYRLRQGLPLPKYTGKVGDLITPEKDKEYWEEWSLWHDAGMRFERYVMNLYFKRYPFGTSSHRDQTIAEDGAWLSAIWAARKISPPSESQIDAWIEEMRQKAEAYQQKAREMARERRETT